MALNGFRHYFKVLNVVWNVFKVNNEDIPSY